MQHIEVKLELGEEEIAAVSELLGAAARVDGDAPLSEHKWLDLIEGGRKGFVGFIAREAGQPGMLGYGQLAQGNNSWSLEYVLHPSIRDDGAGLADALLRSALDQVGREGGGEVHLWMTTPTAEYAAVAAALGFVRGRELYQMRRFLPLDANERTADPVLTRSFVVGEDEQAWLDLNRQAFFEHPDQGAWDLTTLLERERQPWFDPKGFLLHEGVEGIDGFCWTKVQTDRGGLVGEIYVLGVDPRQRAHGLGRGLLIAGLAHLGDQGIGHAMLYVDADNAPAVALYRSLGFVVSRSNLAYHTTVAPDPQ